MGKERKDNDKKTKGSGREKYKEIKAAAEHAWANWMKQFGSTQAKMSKNRFKLFACMFKMWILIIVTSDMHNLYQPLFQIIPE